MNFGFGAIPMLIGNCLLCGRLKIKVLKIVKSYKDLALSANKLIFFFVQNFLFSSFVKRDQCYY